jgi:hypothetical protein
MVRSRHRRPRVQRAARDPDAPRTGDSIRGIEGAARHFPRTHAGVDFRDGNVAAGEAISVEHQLAQQFPAAAFAV